MALRFIMALKLCTTYTLNAALAILMLLFSIIFKSEARLLRGQPELG